MCDETVLQRDIRRMVEDKAPANSVALALAPLFPLVFIASKTVEWNECE